MCPAHKDCLAEGRDAHRISGSAITKIKVEVVAAIEEITGHEVVIATLIVNAVGEVEPMERRLDNALYLGEINAKARSNINAARNVVHGSGIAAGDAEWPDFIVGSQPRASREASRQLCQSCRSGRNIGALENGFGRENFLVKTAEDERLVLHDRSANCESAKLIIQTRLLGQVIACCIGHKAVLLDSCSAS